VNIRKTNTQNPKEINGIIGKYSIQNKTEKGERKKEQMEQRGKNGMFKLSLATITLNINGLNIKLKRKVCQIGKNKSPNMCPDKRRFINTLIS
jgi:hypothetical protein